MGGQSDLWLGGITQIAAGQFTVRQALGGGFALVGRAELGSATAGNDGDLMKAEGPALYSGFEAGFEKNRTLSGYDRLGIWFSQPMRVEQSDVTLRLARGRKKDGTIIYETYKRSLAPDSRQVDVGLSYSYATPDAAHLAQVGLVQSFNSGHVAGELDTSVAASYRLRF